MPAQNGAPPEIGSRVDVEQMEAAPVGAQIANGDTNYTKQPDELWHRTPTARGYRTNQFAREDGIVPGYHWAVWPGVVPTVGTRPTVAAMTAAPVGARVMNNNSGNQFTKQDNGRWRNTANGAEHSSQAFFRRLADYTWVEYPNRMPYGELPRVRVLDGGHMPHGQREGWTPTTHHYLEGTGNPTERDYYRLVIPMEAPNAEAFTVTDPDATRWIAVNMPGMMLRQWWIPKGACEVIEPIPVMGSVPTLADMRLAPPGSTVTHRNSGRVRTKSATGTWSSEDKRAVVAEGLTLRNYRWTQWGEEEVTETPRPHLASTLWLISMEDTYSIYETPEGTEVWLQHGTGREMTEFARLDVAEEWKAWSARYGPYDPARFITSLRERVIDPARVTENVAQCSHCAAVVLTADTTATKGDYRVCAACVRHYTPCGDCGELTREHTLTERGTNVCRECLRMLYTRCRNCDVWFHNEDGGHRHDGSDCCRSPMEQFTIRNDGKDPLPQDTRTMVSLGAGVLSGEGQVAIREAIVHWVKRNPEAVGYWRHDDTDAWKIWETTSYLGELGEKWQTKEGNYPKRFAKLAYQRHKIKVPVGLISEIGNIGALHTKGADYHIETTRYLDGPAADYAQPGSCWWQSYWHCRCMLKSNGGFGIRTFYDADSTEVTGRAWVIPLRAANGGADLLPTFDTMSPDAFIVFNAYGTLVQYTAPRILAHMAGMSYKALDLGIECVEKSMYLNGGSGYLVAPEPLINQHNILRLRLNQHADLFETEKEKVA